MVDHILQGGSTAPWIKRKRSQPQFEAFYPELMEDHTVGEDSCSAINGKTTSGDVNMLTKACLAIDVLQEDIRFFQTIRSRVLETGSEITPHQYNNMLGLRKLKLLETIEANYPIWMVHRMDKAGGFGELTGVLEKANLLEPCYGNLLDVRGDSLPPLDKVPLTGSRKRLSKRIDMLKKDRTREAPLERRLRLDTEPEETHSGEINTFFYDTDPDVTYQYLPYTQSSLGGGTACTSISFASITVMRDYKTVQKAAERINWSSVIGLGIRIWESWRLGQPASSLSGFQTIYDLTRMETLQKSFAGMGGEPKEHGGNIDGSLPLALTVEGTPEDIRAYRKSYPSLPSSLTRMLRYGTGTVAVVTIGVISLSVFAQVVGRGEGHFLIFDSHNSKYSSGNCTLATATNSASASRVISDMCSAIASNNQLYIKSSYFMSIGSELIRGTYCIYVFPKKKKKRVE